MKRRSKAGGKPVKTRPGKTVRSKRGNALKAALRRNSSSAGHEAKIALLTRERDEALEREKATVEVLRVISSSSGELQRVFQTILENATRLCEAKFGNVYLWDGDAFRLVAAHNTPPAFAKRRKRAPFRPNPSHPFRGLVETKEVFHVADVAALPGYKERDPQIVEPVELGGIRTCLGVPMSKDDNLIGALVIFRQEVRPFSDKQIELVKDFAAQAVIAIENARLLNELRQRTIDLTERTNDLTESLEQQTATSEVLRVISSSPGKLEPVFQTMLENAIHICQAKFGNLFLIDGDGCRWAAGVGTPPKLAEYFTQSTAFRPTPGGHLDRVMRTKQVSHSADDTAEAVIGAAAGLGGARSTVCVPMLKGDALVGAIFIYRTEVRPFTEKQIALLQNFAAQAVIAIENARLLSELRESLEQQTATTEVLQVISSSPGDAEPVFVAMLEKAVRICDAKFGNIYRWDGEALHLLAAFNTPPALAEARKRKPMRVEGNTLVVRMLEAKAALQLTDVAATPGYLNRTDAGAVEGLELGGARTAMAVPMLKDGELIGSFTMFRGEVRPFTEKQVELVTSFAAQAVIAIENARLLTECGSP